MTTEVLRRELNGELKLRMSMAQITSNGPFSQFAGIERSVCLLKGNGFELKGITVNQSLKHPLQWFTFQGEDEIFCKLLDGECLDFNIMINRNFGSCNIENFPEGIKEPIQVNSETYLYDLRNNEFFIYENELILPTSVPCFVIKVIRK